MRTWKVSLNSYGAFQMTSDVEPNQNDGELASLIFASQLTVKEIGITQERQVCVSNQEMCGGHIHVIQMGRVGILDERERDCLWALQTFEKS